MQIINEGQNITKGQEEIPSLEGKLLEGRTLSVSRHHAPSARKSAGRLAGTCYIRASIVKDLFHYC